MEAFLFFVSKQRDLIDSTLLSVKCGQAKCPGSKCHCCENFMSECRFQSIQ